MRTGMMRAISELAKDDPNVMLLTGDVGFGLLEDFQEKYPLQHINTGIAEQNMIGVATGLSLEGAKVFVYSIGNFPIFRCLEQIRNGICYHNLNVTIISIGAGFSYGALGFTHHATEDISVMRAMPNMRVFSPITQNDAYDQMHTLYKSNFPSYVRLEKTSINEDISCSNISEMVKQYKTGEEIAILALGGITQEAINAADMLKKDRKIKVAVYGFTMIKYLDEKIMESIISNYDVILTVEEHVLSGGFGSSILECASNLGLLNKRKFHSIGIKNTFSKLIGTQDYLRSMHGLDKNGIYDRIVKIIS
jgi:transketolase